MPYYHYTSRSAAQNIIATGIIQPGSDGFVYLATEVYATGASAADALGIEKVVEIAFEISDSPPPRGLSLPFQALPIFGPHGDLRRRGGGTEVRTANPISISTNEAKWLTIREP
jgi:hypothetical protein